MIDEQQWITVPQAASLLDLRKRTVKRWVHSGRLQSRRDQDGNLGVSLTDVELLRRDLFAEPSMEAEPDEANPPRNQGDGDVADTTADEAAAVGVYVAEDPVAEDSVDEQPRNSSTPEPETVPAQNASRDPLSALEHQAERSIQVAGAAFHEAKELAVAYREELQAARREHREELHRIRRNGNVAWTLVAAAVVVIVTGGWYLGRQFGDRNVYETRMSNLADRLEQTASENQNLQKRIETLKTESNGAASELRTARLGQADAVGQLAAYRAHAGRLTHRVEVLETQIQQERSAHTQALAKAKQQAVLAEQKRLAMIRKERAEQAERERRKIAAQARAQRETRERQYRRDVHARQARATRRRTHPKRRTRKNDAALARVDRRTQRYRRRNAAENLTLTELENALTPKK